MAGECRGSLVRHWLGYVLSGFDSHQGHGILFPSPYSGLNPLPVEWAPGDVSAVLKWSQIWQLAFSSWGLKYFISASPMYFYDVVLRNRDNVTFSQMYKYLDLRWINWRMRKIAYWGPSRLVLFALLWIKECEMSENTRRASVGELQWTILHDGLRRRCENYNTKMYLTEITVWMWIEFNWLTDQTSPSCRQHSYFVFRRSVVQIWARMQAILSFVIVFLNPSW